MLQQYAEECHSGRELLGPNKWVLEGGANDAWLLAVGVLRTFITTAALKAIYTRQVVDARGRQSSHQRYCEGNFETDESHDPFPGLFTHIVGKNDRGSASSSSTTIRRVARKN